MARFLARLRRAWALLGDRLGNRLKRSFFIYLAVLFTLAALADTFSINYFGGMRHKSFDLMVKYRFHVAPPSPDIVIVDIDEKSLSELAPELGRWPWPRQVFGEFLQKLSAQRPRAVVFDILFSDADVFNPDSDAYFNEVIAATDNTWFPMVRLDPAHDGQSQLRVSAVPGVRRLTPSADEQATLALILPWFSSAQESGRLGTNNIWPDKDGIARSYAVYRNEHGFELPSLPLALARQERPGLAPPADMLINWRGQPFDFRYVSFSDLFADLRKEHPTRPADEFRDRIVIVGSTAPALFDIKATAVNKQFPGVEILATAIDNLRREDWLRQTDSRLLNLGLELLILWGTAWAFYARGGNSKLDRLYSLSQLILLGVGYIMINLANTFVNFTGPVMFGFYYFSAARIYAFATERALDTSVVMSVGPAGAQSVRGLLLALRFDVPVREEGSLEKLAGQLCAGCRQGPSAEWLSGRQRGLWRLCENLLVLCWVERDGGDAEWEAIRREADAVAERVPKLLEASVLGISLPAERLTVARVEGAVACGDHRSWHALLGAALMQLEGEKKCK